jgi:alpha-glucosidase
MRSGLRYFSFLFLLLNHYTVFAQTSPVKSAGNITKVTINGQQVDITTDNAYAQVTVYSANIIRVRMDKQQLGKDFSYAVISQPLKTNSSITQNDAEIDITTDSLKAVIKKSPFAISFYTKDGKVINEDEPGLQTSWVNESVTDYKKMQDGEHFIGLGEKTGHMDRKGNGYTNWNTDAYAYNEDRDPIYSTIPFYIGIHYNLSYGIFLDNTWQSDFNFGASNNRFSSFGARGGEMNYYFIYHSTLAGIITSYTSLTGRMKLPPLWSLGYQQNRYSYYPETEVMRIAQTLREKKIPADGITLDIHYMDHYKVFTWDKDRFPNPKQMTDKLGSMGFKLTVIVDPGVKTEQSYATFESGVKNNIFIKYPDSTNYTGQVWPGWCNFPDFTNQKARDWWGGQIKKYGEDGVSGLWNDMNEIATWGSKMPDNVLFDFEGRKASHLEAHNVYGFNMAKASYEGAKKAFGKRPFILTRSGYAGLQRYTAIWTGDNVATDEHMLLGVRLLNSLGLSGVPFTGMDIGGFTGGTTVPLYERWIQIGAFNPYFRSHTAVNTRSSEPWTYGEEALEIARNFISLRYKLMPYLYSTFYEATQDGLPVMRSLAINYTHDENIYSTDFENQYLFGPAFMVAPFVSGQNYGKVYFPAGKWYDLYNDEVETGGQSKIVELSAEKLPVFVKESSIVPVQSLVQSTSEQPTDTLVVHVYKGDANNSFVYYEDDGQSFNYENGAFYKRTISYIPANNEIAFAKTEGSMPSKFHNIKLMLHGFDSASAVKMNGKQVELKDDFNAFINPVSRFDPQGFSNPVEGAKVKSIVFKNENDRILINY